MGPEATRAASQVDRRHGGIAEVSRRLLTTFGSRCDVDVDTRPGVGTRSASVCPRCPPRTRAGSWSADGRAGSTEGGVSAADEAWAVDWSGDARAARRRIRLARAVPGGLLEVRGGLDRDEVVAHVLDARTGTASSSGRLLLRPAAAWFARAPTAATTSPRSGTSSPARVRPGSPRAGRPSGVAGARRAHPGSGPPGLARHRDRGPRRRAAPHVDLPDRGRGCGRDRLGPRHAPPRAAAATGASVWPFDDAGPLTVVEDLPPPLHRPGGRAVGPGAPGRGSGGPARPGRPRGGRRRERGRVRRRAVPALALAEHLVDLGRLRAAAPREPVGARGRALVSARGGARTAAVTHGAARSTVPVSLGAPRTSRRRVRPAARGGARSSRRRC